MSAAPIMRSNPIHVRLVAWCAALFAGLLLASCATLSGPREVELPLSKLQQGLEKRFPVNQKILEMFEIRLTRPQLTTLPDEERIAVTIDTAIGTPMTPQPWNGSLALSGRLAVDTARNAVVLRDARIDRLVADGMDETRQRLMARVASLVADRVIQDIPLYSFRPEDLRYAGVQFAPTVIKMTANALLITFSPVK